MTNEPQPYLFLVWYKTASQATNAEHLRDQIQKLGAIEVIPGQNMWAGRIAAPSLYTRPEDIRQYLCGCIDQQVDQLFFVAIEGVFSVQTCGPGFERFLDYLYFPPAPRINS